jgi:hypothetical protein
MVFDYIIIESKYELFGNNSASIPPPYELLEINNSFLAFINTVINIAQNVIFLVDSKYDCTRVILQEYITNQYPYAEIIEHGNITYKSVIILNKGIIISLGLKYKIRISQSDINTMCDLMLMDFEEKFIDLVSLDGQKYYSKLIPKIVNISCLENEFFHLLYLLALPASTF